MDTSERDQDLSLASKIAYVVSHDLRAPVNHIKSYLKLLQRDLAPTALNERARADLEAIEVSADRMESLIHALSRFAAVPSCIQVKPVSMNQCLKEAVRALEPLFQVRNIVFEVGDLPEVMGDFEQLTSLFYLLIHNAIIYNHSDPIWLECFSIQKSGETIFCVKDNGDGVPKAHQEQIFEPSKRLHSLRDYPGSGMGLAICQRIVEAHGGKIWVESSGVRNEGSIFKFILSTSSS